MITLWVVDLLSGEQAKLTIVLKRQSHSSSSGYVGVQLNREWLLRDNSGDRDCNFKIANSTTGGPTHFFGLRCFGVKRPDNAPDPDADTEEESKLLQG